MQEAVTFNNLYVNLGNAIIKVYQMQITEAANQHGEACIISVMDKSFGQQVIDHNPVTMLIYYVDQEGEEEKESVHSLFAGIISNIQVDVQGDQYYMTVTAKASTSLMDAMPLKCSYQDSQLLNTRLFGEIMERSKYGLANVTVPEQPINQFLIQYEETDWTFLKRAASCFHVRIFPDNRDTVVLLHIGLPQETVDVQWDELPYQVYQDLESYHYLQKNHGDQLHNWSCTRYIINTYDILRLGTKVKFRGKEQYIGKVTRIIYDGLVMNQYTLYDPEGLWMPRLYNFKITGTSVMGIVKSIKRDKIQVDLAIDQGYRHKNYRWFSYSTMASFGKGKGWYAMPLKGEQVRIFFPDHLEEKGYAVTCMNDSVKTNIIQEDWDLQSIQGPGGEEITFLSNGVVMRGKGTEVLLTTDGKISFQNASNITMNAGKEVTIGAGEKLSVKANSEIRFATPEGWASITKGAIGFVGGQVHLNDPE